MAKFVDFFSDPEVKNIMERFSSKFPGMFAGFNIDLIHVVFTKKKKSRKPIRLVPVRYPFDVFVGKPYIIEVFDEWWQKFNMKQKNLAVFHVMCAIPEGGFDEQSSHYGKKVRPDVEMYLREFAASGGVPNWLENDLAKDPMELQPEDVVSVLTSTEEEDKEEDAIPEIVPEKVVERSPVTPATIASLGA